MKTRAISRMKVNELLLDFVEVAATVAARVPMTGVPFQLVRREWSRPWASDQLPKFSRALSAHQQATRFSVLIVTWTRSNRTRWAARQATEAAQGPGGPSRPRWPPGRAGSWPAARSGPGRAPPPPRPSPPPPPARPQAWTGGQARRRTCESARRARHGRAGQGHARPPRRARARSG